MFKTTKRLVAMLICLAMVLSMVPAVFAADAAGTTLYMTPSSNWLEASPWFAAYFFGDNGDTWVKMADSDNDGTYEVVVPEGGYTKVIFCRMDPGKLDTLDWSAKWTQTGDLSIPSDDNVLYVVSGWGGGDWTTIGGTIEQDTNYYLRGSMNNWVADESNKMTDNGDGTWSITMVLAANSYQYKAGYSDWSVAVGDPNASNPDGNAELTLSAETEVTFVLDTNAGTLTATYNTECAHTNVTAVAGKDATCTEAGLTKGEVCADCSYVIVAQTEIPALGHDIVDGACTVCGLTVEMVTVYYENNWMFQDLTAYWWGSSISNPEWPGVAPEVFTTTDAGYIVYSIEVPSDAAGLLFAGKDNDNGSDRKTPDIVFEANLVYYMNWSEELGEHVLSYDVSNLVPTCEHEYTYECDTICNKCFEETREASHSIKAVEAKAASCYEDGNIAYWYCEHCGSAWADEAQTQVTNLKSVIIPMAHAEATHVEAVAPTCYEEGNIEYWYCEACGQAWLDADCTLNTNLKAVVLPAAHGAATHVEAKAPTCYEDGNIEYWYCEACGQAWLDADCTLNTNLKAVILPMAHAEATHVEAKAPTCYEDGNIEYWYCEACGQAWLDADCTLNTNLKAVVLPMAHGTIVHVEAKDATCAETGNIEYWYCEDCGQAWLDEACTLNTNLKAVILPTVDHEYFYPCDPYCMNCYELTNPDAFHNIIHVEAVEATCTEMGNVEYWYCEDCGCCWLDEACTMITNRMSVVTFAEHDYQNNVCTVCGDMDVEVAYQVSDDGSAIRLIAYVDDLANYSSVTFTIYANGNELTFDVTKGYTSIRGGEEVYTTADLFGADGSLALLTLNGIPADAELSVDVCYNGLDGESTYAYKYITLAAE